MRKYLELFINAFDDTIDTKTKPENKPYIGYSIEDDKVIYTISPEAIVYDRYVTFTAEEDNSSIGLNQLSTGQTMEYSMDTITWNTFDTTTNISLNNGDKVYVRGVLRWSNSSGEESDFTQFTMSGKIAAGGNCNAIWNHKNLNAPIKAYCGYYMFSNCTSLTTAPELPATTLAKSCYNGMFNNCTSLTTAPELPATTLDVSCYAGMFSVCSSLTTAPELPATTLAKSCYNGMFNGCTSLTVAPELPATELAYGCYSNMFGGCTSLTTAPQLLSTTLADHCYDNMFSYCSSLTTAPVLPATTLAPYCYQSMFSYCSSLTVAPELPATELTNGCYSYMFQNCSSLTTAPELPATTLADYCYQSMFSGCTFLTVAPQLHSTELAESCYQYMFSGCTYLTTAPVLPATTLAPYCYQSMFYGCTSLNHITCLATDISAWGCTDYWVYDVSSTGTFVKHPDMNNWTTGYSGIPSGWIVKDAYTPQECVKLEITADDVSGRKTNTTIYYTATTNGIDYKGDRVEGRIVTGTATSNEFEQNKSYTDTVERTITFEFMGVTATTTITQGVWVDASYEVVLNDQWRLSETQSNPDSTLYDGVYESFSNKGVDNSTATMYLDLIGYTEFDVYIRSYAESSYDYVTISEPNSDIEKATTSGNQNSGQDINSYIKVHYDNLTGDDRITITYRKDYSASNGDDQGYILIPKPDINDPKPIISGPWVTFTAEEDNSSIGLSKLSTSQTLEYSTDTATWNTFDTTTNISLNNGDKVQVRGMLSGDNMISDYTQFKMTGKIAASGNCNAIWNYQDLNVPLKERCGCNIFRNCTSLTVAPELPATTLASSCYSAMFSGCTSLTTAPELPATVLADSCYSSMFSGCTSLTTASELLATRLAVGCYQSMFYNCTSLTIVPEILPATTLKNSCYRYMFYGCSSLTTAPELPATELDQGCYEFMFQNCTSLTTAPEILPATTLSYYCYSAMFSGCTSLTTAPELPATRLNERCYQNMFYECTSLTTAPELPATTLTKLCYNNMFYKCTSLNNITCLATDISATDCTSYWLHDVSSTGTFIKHPDMNDWTTSWKGIPEGWTVVEAELNEIWYTSSDGNVVYPYDTYAFGANIVSNTYEDGKGVIKFDNSITSIGEWAFKDRKSLTSIIIPNSVTSIGNYAFYYCTSLTSVIIPNSIISIGNSAFASCSSLTSVTIPNSVTSIGSSAFNYCTSLTSVTIPNSVTSIEMSTFEYCSSLTSVTIGNSVTHITDWTFRGCSSLTSITFEGTMEEWNSITKGSGWNYNVPATYIQCTDGQVAL